MTVITASMTDCLEQALFKLSTSRNSHPFCSYLTLPGAYDALATLCSSAEHRCGGDDEGRASSTKTAEAEKLKVRREEEKNFAVPQIQGFGRYPVFPLKSQ